MDDSSEGKSSSVDPGVLPGNESAGNLKEAQVNQPKRSKAADNLQTVDPTENVHDDYHPHTPENLTCTKQWKEARQKLQQLYSAEILQEAERLLNENSIQPKRLLDFFTLLSSSFPDGDSLCRSSINDGLLPGGKNSNPSWSAGPDPSGGSGLSGKKSLPRSWYRPSVRVYCVTTGQTCGADRAIMEYVKKKTWMTQVEEISHPGDSDVIVVFCPIMFRVGSDVEAAMKHPEVASSHKPAVLVLLHHTRDKEFSAEGRKWSKVYSNVASEFNLLFHETRQGLLKCSRNIQEVGEIQKELHSYAKTRWSL